MRDAAVWRLLLAALEEGVPAALMVVVESIGSSPGRRGFKMAVAADGRMAGSIGGGIMEHKLVTYVRDRLQAGRLGWEVRRQVHSKEVAVDQSGMICSGSQVLVMTGVGQEGKEAVRRALEGGGRLVLDRAGLRVEEGSAQGWDPEREVYSEALGKQRRVVVVGGGHVGLALCKLLHMLDFHVTNVDDRPGLNTMEENVWADEKVVWPYEALEQLPGLDEEVAVVLVTFGYRTDEVCLRRLAGRKFRYVGMMGSRAKVEAMWRVLLEDGIPALWLAGVRAPAGVQIHSKTPMEIAVSIAAEVVEAFNRNV